MNKKAISPLIATVLIIGFTVALAAIVMTWGGSFMRSTTEETEVASRTVLKCSTDLDFRIIDFDCSAGTVTIENRGREPVKSFDFRLRYNNGSVNSGVSTGVTLDVFEIESMGIGITPPLTGANQIDAMATIGGEQGGDDIKCTQAVEDYRIDPVCT